MAKKQRTILLPPEVWAQIDDLEGYFGGSPAEIITHILRIWFANNQREIRETKARIDELLSGKKDISPG